MRTSNSPDRYILIPVEFEDQHTPIVNYGVKLASELGYQVKLLHVIATPAVPALGGGGLGGRGGGTGPERGGGGRGGGGNMPEVGITRHQAP